MNRSVNDGKEHVSTSTVSSTVSSIALPTASYTVSPTAPSTTSEAGFSKFSKRNIFIGTSLIIIGLLWLFTLFSQPIQKAYTAANEFFKLSTNEQAIAADQIAADAAVVYDIQSGEVLFYKNEKEKLPPASTTKMMTALLALEEIELNQRVGVGPEVTWVKRGESKVGLRPGQLLTWEELIAAMLLPSGNDAARTIAVNIGMKYAKAGATREEAYHTFVAKMNERAQKIGMHDTNFANPHGMDEYDHYSTANDLALLAKEAMKDKRFRDIVKQEEFQFTEAANGPGQEIIHNRNQLLQPESEHYYEGAIGIKTGFTDGAGYCLVSAAEQEGRQMIAVVLHSTKEQVWTDSRILLEYGFDIK
ncbi:D-alanyl-D-alanine carboxypeptidase [Paenibacillus sp. SC116]|uniref:D-alanyl-D-alanine carboxypeptidase family protein n=1 Tax=Paenibacillus sp. SC116 TaxID=2968986 RepID=UPI00215B58BF|nr:D-alanyl-D-alanine carboxypeptidase family protein [Paenibacillus sp. SC116]MCR8845046.1 D-alanyl-D-alanine carboxypeptidase [Paenibacillus sp. SC116]